jgi:hypothetical protein
MAGYLNTDHRPHFGVAYFVRHSDLSAGDVVTFMYKGKMRWAFVLDPDYEGKMHALTLELTPRSTLINEVIDMMYETPMPADLYDRAVYKVASQYDSYRTYFVKDLQQLRRLPYHLTAKPTLRKDNKK